MLKTEQILREEIRKMLKALILEKGNKPGGGLTDLGALKRISPVKWKSKVTSTLDSTDGDVEKTANSLNVSPSTMYAAISNDAELQSKKDSLEDDQEKD